MGELRILSSSSEAFKDRREAGKLLAEEFTYLKGEKIVVLGIPRGGIVIANEMAKRLDAELDIVLARKLRTPGQPELAMGSITEDGKVFLNNDVINMMGVTEQQIEYEKVVQMEEIKRRSALIRRLRPHVPVEGKIAIVTDDGVATGATTQAAFWAVRHEKPQKLIAAIPVGSEETIKRLANEVDEMVCLRTPRFFAAVGQFYERFDPVEDDDVIRILSNTQVNKKNESREFA
jgi:putative phosphoribosyl transferase